MAARYMPKTLAKTLTYIALHSPGEYGLYWDTDGTMPWKELYWALQEDSSLRFVRESHLRELAYLGLELPFHLDGTLLRIENQADFPAYQVVEPPERLFFACPRKRFLYASRHGLSPTGSRSGVALAVDRELALKVGRRRDPDPILIEVLAKRASLEGNPFRMVDSGLYLADRVPVEFLMCPRIPENELPVFADRVKKEKVSAPAHGHPHHPGSFYLEFDSFQGPPTGADASRPGKDKRKGRKGPGWKQDARNSRNKRNV